MKQRYIIVPFILILLLTCTTYSKAEDTGQYVHHQLKVSINPVKQWVQVTDTVTLPQPLVNGKEKIHFLLHGNLKIVSAPKQVKIKKEKGELKSEFFGINTAQFEIKKKIPVNHFSISTSQLTAVPGKGAILTIVYEGKIHHEIKKIGAEYARGFSETPGIIDGQGAYLAGATFWVPWFNDQLVTFNLQTLLPLPYDSVSQGKRTLHQQKEGKQLTVWDSPEPMDEIYLIAAKFKEFNLEVGSVNVQAFLRSEDQGLANKYLETTGQYLEMYEKIIGPYPYSKFALIENFWETGYGMPSFTLLGSKIIRFPFILHSSYPHELLHNWWGNSVFVDYASGNWCEGLTAYMADHLIKEQRGQGTDYRKTTLQGYTHYAAGKKEEFPLSQFKARYDALSSAVGYGKSLMVFHMLRLQVGDRDFNKAMQHFYKENKYKRASWKDIRTSFEAVTGKNFADFFEQWINRSGAPSIRLKRAAVQQKDGQYILRIALEQQQKSKPFKLNLPIAVSFEEEKEARIMFLDFNERYQEFKIPFHRQPTSVKIDPRFDVFRTLHSNEIPAALSRAFGAKSVLMLLPSKASAALLKGYRQLAETWAGESKDTFEIKLDNEVPSLPKEKAIWLLGWENSFRSIIERGLLDFPVSFSENSMTIEKKALNKDERSIVAAIKNPCDPSNVIVMLSSDRAAALPGLGRKLPHYGRYSYLAFEGDEPANVLKGQWPEVHSPLSFAFPIKSQSGESIIYRELPKEKPLAHLAPLFNASRMMDHVRYLASEELEGRGLGSDGIDKALNYIAAAFKEAGLKPGGNNDSFFQEWQAEAGKDSNKKTVKLRNIIGILPGKNPEFKDQASVICAHYDHLGLGWPDVRQGNEGKIHYGADDNASGVAVLLELAHSLGKSLVPERSILFIAFSGEESGLLGSAYFVEQLTSGTYSPYKTVNAVVNMDTVGRLGNDDKLMVIGGNSAREWRFIFMGIGYTVGVESQLVTQELDASDQVSFIKAGIPGIQLFTGPHTDYHRPTDTADKVRAAGLVKVAAVAKETIVYLSERKEPLTAQGPALKKGTAAKTEVQPQSGRRVRTGLMPDFAFSGKGVKIGMVSPDSPIEKAGLQKGDIIIQLNGTEVANLKEYSNLLKTYKPGDTIQITYTRDNQQHTAPVTLGAR